VINVSTEPKDSEEPKDNEKPKDDQKPKGDEVSAALAAVFN
jgi:hypothetical protein